MALEKKEITARIDVDEDGTIFVRKAFVYLDDGIEVARTNHSITQTPGSDVAKHSDRVKAISQVVWTKDVVDAFNEKMSKINSNTIDSEKGK